MNTVIPDASVILKWVLPSADERDRAAALQLREQATKGKVRIRTPSLWLYEVGNTLTRRAPNEAGDLLEALLSFGLDEAPWTQPWLVQAIELTSSFKVTFYDAAYHALAIVERGVFVTADLQYLNKAGKAGAVVALQNWK